MTDPERVLRGLDEHERSRQGPVLPERYERGPEVGRGGMAVVYRARDRQLDREVAVKVLRDDVGPADRARFHREAEAAARLSHPNVVTVFDSGPTWLAMELVRGGPLVRERFSIDLLEKVARAVHAAHEQGIVHRDLKPSNILLTDAGEPKVADFGIARLSGEHTRLTANGSILGTPAYMAPEQAEGAEVTPRTDVYALGAILYEALTGQPPFGGSTPMEVLRRIVHEDTRPPRDLRDDVPLGLQTIALKALEKHPSRRYPTALAFAEDLRRFREGAPIEARPPSALHRWSRRLARRAAPIVAGIALAALALALGLTLPKIRRHERTLRLWGDISVALRDAELHARRGDARRARDVIDAGIAACREHDFAAAHYFRGRLLRARGLEDEALRALDRALELDPGLGEARYERGLLRVDRYARWLARVQTAFAGRGPASGPLQPPSGDDLEREHPHLGELRRRAIEDLSVPVGASAYFRPLDARFGRAELERLRWNWDTAREELQAVLVSDPLYVQAHVSLARLALMLGRWGEAAERCRAVLAEHKGCGAAHAILADALFWLSESDQGAAGLREESLRHADQAILLGEPAQAIRGNVLQRLGRAAEAVEAYDQAIALEPRDAIALNHRGRARMVTGDVSGAVRDFSDAVAISPGYAMAWYNRALARLQVASQAEALADAERALSATPPHAPYRAEIARLADFLREAVRPR